jgi:hypothetical protein
MKQTNKKTTPLTPQGGNLFLSENSEIPFWEFIPESLRNEKFTASWLEWIQHRREKKKPVTKLSAKKSLEAMKGWDTLRAVAAIGHSIANGWQGIFEPAGRNGKPAPAKKPFFAPTIHIPKETAK